MKPLAALVLLAGCASAPEGFTLQIRFVSIDPEVIDMVRLSLTPEGADRFMVVEDMSFEGGAITTRVESGGEALVMEIAGDHVREHVTRPDGVQYLYEIEMWSDDPTMDDAPRVLGSVVRETESIGQGSGYLPGWPPPLGVTAQLAIQCSPASVDRCTP